MGLWIEKDLRVADVCSLAFFSGKPTSVGEVTIARSTGCLVVNVEKRLEIGELVGLFTSSGDLYESSTRFLRAIQTSAPVRACPRYASAIRLRHALDETLHSFPLLFGPLIGSGR